MKATTITGKELIDKCKEFLVNQTYLKESEISFGDFQITINNSPTYSDYRNQYRTKKFKTYYDIPIQNKKKKGQLFIEPFFENNFFPISLVNSSSIKNHFKNKKINGSYVITCEENIVYIGDSNSTLLKRLNQFVNACNFGIEHIGGNKIFFIRNFNLLSKNLSHLTPLKDTKEILDVIPNQDWFMQTDMLGISNELRKAKSFKIDYIGVKFGKGHSLRLRRLVSMMESFMILAYLKSVGDSKLPLNWD